MTITELFEAYRTEPGEETLLGLLRGTQDFVYNVCYQVLHHPQDAEDASQRVFLRALEVLPRVSDGTHLRSLLVRISFQVALNLSDARAARARHERSKAAMTPPTTDVDPEEVRALHGAIAALDPRLGAVVVERYFEGKSLEGIAEGRGCSVAAVWKRLEKAKEMLRRSLQGAGLGSMAAQLGSRLEAMTFMEAPKDLITPAITSKVLEVAQAAALGSASAGATGVGLFSGRTAAVGFMSLLLGGFAGEVCVVLSRDAAPPSVAAIPAGASGSASAGRAPGVARALAAPVPEPVSAAPLDLETQLRGFRDQLLGPRKVEIAAKARQRELEPQCRPELAIPDELLQVRNRLEVTRTNLAGLTVKGWKDYHRAVLADPATYVSVLLEPESGDACLQLLELLAPFPPPPEGPQGGFILTEGPLSEQGAWQGFIHREDVPSPVAQALEALLTSGSAEQKLAVFDAIQWKTPHNAALEATCVQFLAEADPRLQERALSFMNLGKSVERHLDALKGCWKRTSDGSIMKQVVESLYAVEGPEARALYWDYARGLLERNAEGPRAAWDFIFRHPPARDEEEQYATLAALALSRKFDMESRTDLVIVLEGTLSLPLPKALRILDQARPSLNPVFGIAVGRMADAIRAGETRPSALFRAFGSAFPLPKEED